MTRPFFYVLPLLLFLSTAPAGAEGPKVRFEPPQAGVRLVPKSDLGGDVTSTFLVTVKGAEEAARSYEALSGVLFQGVARPADTLAGSPISLSFERRGQREAKLKVSFGQDQAVSSAPAWVWAVAARFARHRANGALTLNDDSKTVGEKRFGRQWRRENNGRLLWARYHPVLDDTLIGFCLLGADAMLADPEKLHGLTNGLQDVDDYFPATSAKPPSVAKRLQAARTIKTVFSMESKPGDFGMLNDVDATFRFDAVNGELIMSGEPSFHFARKIGPKQFESIERLDDFYRDNRHLFRTLDRRLNDVVTRFSQLVAFFNYVNETNPTELARFVQSLATVIERLPVFETPIAVSLAP